MLSCGKELDIAKVAVYYFTENTTEPLVAVRKSWTQLSMRRR